MSGARREKSRNNYEKESPGIAKIFTSALKSALLAFCISLLLAAALSAVATFSSDPVALVFPMSLAALYISSFLSGLFCIRKKHDGALMSGLFSGGILMLLYMFTSLFFGDEMSASHPFALSLLLHSLIIVFSILGAYAGRHKTSRRKIKR